MPKSIMLRHPSPASFPYWPRAEHEESRSGPPATISFPPLQAAIPRPFRAVRRIDSQPQRCTWERRGAADPCVFAAGCPWAWLHAAIRPRSLAAWQLRGLDAGSSAKWRTKMCGLEALRAIEEMIPERLD